MFSAEANATGDIVWSYPTFPSHRLSQYAYEYQPGHGWLTLQMQKKKAVKIKTDFLKNSCPALSSFKNIYRFVTVLLIPQTKTAENTQLGAEAVFFHIKKLRITNNDSKCSAGQASCKITFSGRELEFRSKEGSFGRQHWAKSEHTCKLCFLSGGLTIARALKCN